MQAFQPFQHILEYIRYDVFWYFFEIIVNEVYHSAAVHELNEHEERLLVVVSEIVSCEIVGVAEVHYCNFCTNLVECTIVFELDNTTGIVLSACLCSVICEKDLAHGTFS